jgi:dihydropyrimidinase
MAEVVEAGVTSFKVFTAYKRAGMMLDDAALLRVFARAAESGAVMMLHAENGDIIDFLTDRLIAAGKVSAPYHPVSRPPLAEAEAVQRAIALATVTGVTLYIVHLTAARALEIIRQAQEEGLPIIAETCPQYLLLTREVYERNDGHCYIASPPLREREDCDALWQGLAEGWISVVGTDHCPFTGAQKDTGGGHFHKTPNGIPGVETLLPLVYSQGVARGRITVNRMVEVLCERPAKIFGLFPRKGRIQEGADADLVIFDPDREFELSARTLHSNTDWSPYEGWRVRGYPERTLLRGKEIMRDRELAEPEARGVFLRSAAEQR